MSSPLKAARTASYSPADVAARLGVSVPTVQRWVDAGYLKAWKTLGGHRRIEAQSAESLFQTQPAPSAAESAGNAPSFAIVDDSPDDRDLLFAVVQTAFPQARCAVFDNGIQALVAIGRSTPDVLITDIVMPYMNGLEMLRQLADFCVTRPPLIIAVSADCDPTGRPRRALPEGVRFLAKPIDAAGFVELLRAEVAGKDAA